MNKFFLKILILLFTLTSGLELHAASRFSADAPLFRVKLASAAYETTCAEYQGDDNDSADKRTKALKALKEMIEIYQSPFKKALEVAINHIVAPGGARCDLATFQEQLIAQNVRLAEENEVDRELLKIAAKVAWTLYGAPQKGPTEYPWKWEYPCWPDNQALSDIGVGVLKVAYGRLSKKIIVDLGIPKEPAEDQKMIQMIIDLVTTMIDIMPGALIDILEIKPIFGLTDSLAIVTSRTKFLIIDASTSVSRVTPGLDDRSGLIVINNDARDDGFVLVS
jgi:hypothetical protein